MSKGYELLFIIQPSLGEEKTNKIAEKVKAEIESNEGEITLFKPWGQQKLETEFRKFKQGYYVQIQFNATEKTLSALRETLKYTEEIIRNLIVTMESIQSNVDPKDFAPKEESARS